MQRLTILCAGLTAVLLLANRSWGVQGPGAAAADCAVHGAALPSATGNGFVDFFTGGGSYMPRTHCLLTPEGNTDWPWVWTLLVLTIGVVVSYLRVFAFWMRCYFGEAPDDRNRKLFDLAMIFLLCATCGYAMSILMFFWPAYRLLAVMLLVLNFFAWRFCIHLEPFRAAFKSGRLERELREEVRSRADQLELLLADRTRELHQSEQRFRTLVQNLPGVAFRVAIDENWTNLFVSDGIREMTGYPASDFINNAVRDCASITHADDLQLVDEAVRGAIERRSTYSVEYRIVHANGSLRWVAERGQVVCDEQTREPAFLDGLQFDITDRKLAEEATRQTAMLDKLTGMPNRALVFERLRLSMARAERDPTRVFAVLFLDFDRFKAINDCLGHDAGDELLRQIAARLRGTLRGGDTVLRETEQTTAGRLGGDEFVVILDPLKEPGHAMQVAQRILEVCRQPYKLGGHEVISTVSIGIVTSQTGSASPDDLLRDADTAMYQAKLAGKGCAVVFDAAMRDKAKERLLLEEELRTAIAEGQLRLVYQPIVSMETGRCTGAEALVRWSNPRRGAVSPAEFIPIAEDCGLISTIGEWVLREACVVHSAWGRALDGAAPEVMSVNLSRSQLACNDLPQVVERILRETGVRAGCLQLEVTENLAARNMPAQIDALKRLRAVGVKLAMDDFGTGMSSLSGLHELPIDVIKIDRSFVSNLGRGKQFMALARSIIELAANLGLKTVAEGIETADDLTVLQTLGCEYGQGYYFAKPMTTAEFEQFARGRGEGRAQAA